MEIKEFFRSKDRTHWLAMIQTCDWPAGQFLYELLTTNQIHKFCGEHVRLFLLTDGTKLAAFCTLSDVDDIKKTDKSPWIGFVYTYPAYRGRHYMRTLLNFACETARNDGAEEVFVATGETGLYEKYGFSFYDMMKNAVGVQSKVYRKELS